MKALINSLEVCLAELQLRLIDADVSLAAVSVIPPVMAGAELDDIEIIEPRLLGAADAVSMACEAYGDLYIKKPFSQKSARRYPGVIHLANGDDTQDIIQLIARINELKTAIQAVVTTQYASRGDRFRAMHEACPGGMTVHIYRQIHLLDNEGVSSLRFTWQKKEVVTTPDKKQLLEQIGAVHAMSEPDAQLPLLLLMDAISKAAEKDLRIRRPVKVQPAANVNCTAGKYTLNAPLPIVVVQNESFALKAIPIFDASIKRKPRSDKNNNDMIGTFNGFQIETISRK